MVPVNAYRATEQETISFSNALPKEANFEALCTGLDLYSDQDVHIAFDGAASSASLFIPKTTFIEITDVKFTRISALGNSTTGTLYLMAKR